jgi:hypothetical protein
VERVKYIASQTKSEWLKTTFQISRNFLLANKPFKLSNKWLPAGLTSNLPKSTHPNINTYAKHALNLL